jgi:outer membrane protein assembly factor BamA
VLLGLLFLSSPAAVMAQAGIDTLRVTGLSFEGNQTFPGRVIQEAILTEDTHCRSVVLAPFCWFGGDWAIEERTLSRPEMARDMARIRLFYFRRGFRETTVDTVVGENGGGGVSVRFRIDEGPPILVTSVEIAGADTLDVPLSRQDLEMRVGEPLSLIELETSREQLISGLRDQGRAHAEVLAGFDIPAETPYEASVRFELLPGPVARYGPIEIRGIQALDEGTVRSVLPIREGDVFSASRLATAQRNVFELEIVRHTEILPQLSHVPDTVVPLDVRVNEAPPHRVRAGGGLSTFECLNVEGRWTSRNFKGGGRRLEATARISNALADELSSTLCNQAGTGVYGQLNYLLGLDFLQPVFFAPRNSLSTRLYVERESFPDLFVREAVGTDLMFSRNVGRLSATGLFYRPQYGSYEAADVYFCSNFLICSEDEIKLVSSTNLLAPVGISLSTDHTSPVTDPIRGWAGLVTFEKAGALTFSDYAYDRFIIEGSAFRELGRGTRRVLGARLRFGFLNPRAFGGVTTETTDIELSAPQKRFFSGGATSVRGFAAGRLGPRTLQTEVTDLVQPVGDAASAVCAPEEINNLSCDANPLPDSRFIEAPAGGNVLFLGNIEFRSWPFERLQTSVFLDFGQVWSEDTDVDLSTIQFTPGIGIRYPTPVGPLRLDLAYNFRGRADLPAITAQLEEFDPDNPREIVAVGEDGTSYVVSDGLAPLIPPVAFGSDDLWSLSRFQLHFSIGQAF